MFTIVIVRYPILITEGVKLILKYVVMITMHVTLINHLNEQ